MNIVISGYGRMGKLVETVAKNRKHNITCILDNANDWSAKEKLIKQSDVIIDFSLPHTVVGNIKRAFEMNVPIVTGTTGWEKERKALIELCRQNNGTLFFAPNFSIGVNIFFEINKKLAALMNDFSDYNVSIEETHHTKKLDAPSGTAVHLADDIIEKLARKEKWVNFATADREKLAVFSQREGNIIGTHKVIYTSEIDTISIEHNAKDRAGFASGAVRAAEWCYNKTGYFEMKDMLNINK